MLFLGRATEHQAGGPGVLMFLQVPQPQGSRHLGAPPPRSTPPSPPPDMVFPEPLSTPNAPADAPAPSSMVSPGAHGRRYLEHLGECHTFASDSCGEQNLWTCLNTPPSGVCARGSQTGSQALSVDMCLATCMSGGTGSLKSDVLGIFTRWKWATAPTRNFPPRDAASTVAADSKGRVLPGGPRSGCCVDPPWCFSNSDTLTNHLGSGPAAESGSVGLVRGGGS